MPFVRFRLNTLLISVSIVAGISSDLAAQSLKERLESLFGTKKTTTIEKVIIKKVFDQAQEAQKLNRLSASSGHPILLYLAGTLVTEIKLEQMVCDYARAVGSKNCGDQLYFEFFDALMKHAKTNNIFIDFTARDTSGDWETRKTAFEIARDNQQEDAEYDSKRSFADWLARQPEAAEKSRTPDINPQQYLERLFDETKEKFSGKLVTAGSFKPSPSHPVFFYLATLGPSQIAFKAKFYANLKKSSMDEDKVVGYFLDALVAYAKKRGITIDLAAQNQKDSFKTILDYAKKTRYQPLVDWIRNKSKPLQEKATEEALDRFLAAIFDTAIGSDFMKASAGHPLALYLADKLTPANLEKLAKKLPVEDEFKTVPQLLGRLFNYAHRKGIKLDLEATNTEDNLWKNFTALFYAILHGNYSLAQWLVGRGAKLHPKGITPTITIETLLKDQYREKTKKSIEDLVNSINKKYPGAISLKKISGK